jgi:glutathione S-transferase
MAPITLFNLPQSRSIRIAWLLEELQLPYDVISSERLPNLDSPPEFKAKIGGLGKVPTIHDGDIMVQESGAVVE